MSRQLDAYDYISAVLVGLGFGVAFAGIVFVLGLGAVFMVGGNGKAPFLAEVILFLALGPSALVGLKENELLVSALIWTFVVGLGASVWVIWKWKRQT